MSFSSQDSSIQKGQIVTNTCNGKGGIVIGRWLNEFTGQYVFNVRVPGMAGFVSWNEQCVSATPSLSALVIGDMVIAFNHDGVRFMGTVTGKTLDGCLIVRFAIGTYAVSLDRVWRAWPAQQNMAVAS